MLACGGLPWLQIDVKGVSPLWVVSFPGQGVLDSQRKLGKHGSEVEPACSLPPVVSTSCSCLSPALTSLGDGLDLEV